MSRISGRGLVGSCHGRLGARERLPVEQTGGDVLVPAEHVRPVGQPHHRGELAQRIVDRARVDHRLEW